jgi:hypothetical protein
MYITYILIIGGDEIQLFSLKRPSIETMKLKLNIYSYITVLQICTWPNVYFLSKKYESFMMLVIVLYRR